MSELRHDSDAGPVVVSIICLSTTKTQIGTAMVSVADRIAALKKKASRSPKGSPKGPPPPGAGSGGKGGKVSDLAGGLATKLNMNAMLAGGTGAPPGAGGGGGKVRPQLAASAGGSGSSGDGSKLAHLANGRPTIPRGRRRPRGAR